MFTEIVRQGSNSGGREIKVNTCSIRVDKRGRADILISCDIYKKLGRPIFFKIAVGSGSDAGLLLLISTNVPGTSAYKACPGSRSGKRNPSVQRRVGMPAQQIRVRTNIIGRLVVPHEITGDGLILDLRQIAAPVAVAAE